MVGLAAYHLKNAALLTSYSVLITGINRNPSKNLTIGNRDIFSTQCYISPGAHRHLSPCNISTSKQNQDRRQKNKNGMYQVPNIFCYH